MVKIIFDKKNSIQENKPRIQKLEQRAFLEHLFTTLFYFIVALLFLGALVILLAYALSLFFPEILVSRPKPDSESPVQSFEDFLKQIFPLTVLKWRTVIAILAPLSALALQLVNLITRGGLQRLLNWFLEKFDEFREFIWDSLLAGLNAIAEFFVTFFEKVWSLITTIWSTMRNTIVNFAYTLWSAFQNFVAAFWNALGNGVTVFLNALLRLREWLRDFFRGGPIPSQGPGDVGPHAPPPGPGDAGSVHGISLSSAADLHGAPGNLTNNGAVSGVELHASPGSMPVAPFGELPHDDPWNPFQDLGEQVDPETSEDTGALARDITARAFQKGIEQHDISPVPPSLLNPPQQEEDQEEDQVQEVPRNVEGPLLGGVNAVEHLERVVEELQRKNAKQQFQERERLRIKSQLSKRAGTVPGIGVGQRDGQSQCDPLDATSTSALTTPVDNSVADHNREDTFKTVAHKGVDFLRKIIKNVPKP